MPYFTIEDFKGGLDVRRSKFTSVPGTLQSLVNAHITRGGDIEKRKAFVDITPAADGGSLRDLAHTTALVGDIDGLIAVGNTGPSGTNLPANTRYMQLSVGGLSMTGVQAWTTFGGKSYIVVNYTDGSQKHWYAGKIVNDWDNPGIQVAGGSNIGMAGNLVSLINADGIYTASNGGPVTFTNVVTVTGPAGVDYAMTGEAVNNDTGGVDDQDILVGTTVTPESVVREERAVGSFSVMAGEEGAGNQVTSVQVIDGGTTTTLTSAAVPFRSNGRVTAEDVAKNINARYGTTKYNAFASLGIVYIYAPYGSGDSANGRVVKVTSAGKCVLNDGEFTITGGSTSAGVNQVAGVWVGGKSVTGAVNYNGDNEQTAADVAAAINAFASSPKVVAVANGATVYLSTQVVRSDEASKTLMVSVNGDVTVTIDTKVDPPGGTPGTTPPDGTGGTTTNPTTTPRLPRVGENPDL